MKEFREFLIPLADLRKKFDIPNKCVVSKVSVINDGLDLHIKTYIEKRSVE